MLADGGRQGAIGGRSGGGLAGALALVDAEYDRTARVARQIWDWAELGYLEDRSSGLIKAELAKEGFRVESGVAEIPTAFVAEWGAGGPVIAILAEYDALPGLSQALRKSNQPRAVMRTPCTPTRLSSSSQW